MKFLPFENFYIVTNLKPDEVQARIAKEIAPKRGFNLRDLFESDPNFYFKGYSGYGTFDIQRIISYRNSFLPQIKGTTEGYLNGSRVHIKMRMMILVIMFTSVWLGIAGMAGISFFLKDINESVFIPESLIPSGMFLFGYALAMGGFKFESRKAKAKLIDMLEGRISETGI